MSRRSRDERGTTQSRQVKRDVPPSASPTLSSSPINGGAFWCGTSSNIKPALTGRWPRAKRADGGVESGLLFIFLNPSVKPSVCQLPGRGAFWYCIASNIKQGDGFPSPQLNNLSRSPAVRRISHGAAIFHIAKAIFHPASAGFHCARKRAYAPVNSLTGSIR